MPVTTLDPKTALVVVDLQKGVVSSATVHPVADIVKRASALADAFRRHHLPVVLVNVAGVPPGRTEQPGRVGRELPPGFTDLIPELHQQPTDHIVTKRARGAFTHTGLEEHLKNLGVSQVVVVGISTSSGVESTVRQAHEAGFNVTLAVDAMTDTTLEAHEQSVKKIFPRLAETGTTQEVLDLLDKAGGPA